MSILKTLITTSLLAVAAVCFLAFTSFLLPAISDLGGVAYAANSPATQSDPANSKAAANCNSNQTATKITSGSDQGKWYCKANAQPAPPQAQPQNQPAQPGGIGQGQGCSGGGCGQQCGAPDQDPYTPAIDIGCKGKGNPIMDALFGIIRFLSDGVGLVVIGSIIVGGIQYSGSRGDPQSTAMAINRIRSSVFALLIFIFAYAMLNYLIPGAVLQ